MSSSSRSITLFAVAFGTTVLLNSTAFAQTAPPVNNTDCSTLTSADIGGSSSITLDGENETSWDVVYNGVTTNLPPDTPTFDIFNIVGAATQTTIRANGFDGMMNPISDDIVCDIPFNPPTCVTSQDPDSSVTPVDIGTVITLTADTTNGVSVVIDAVPMTAVMGTPGIDFAVEWEATSTAIETTTIVGVTTNPEGETVECTWDIQVNNSPPPAPVIVNPADGSTVVIEGLVNQEFIPEWTVSTDPDGDPVTYEWELAADPGFSTVLLSVSSVDNRVVLDFGAVSQLLTSNGVNVGDSITLFHRASASDGNFESEGAAAEVTLTLGEVFSSLPAFAIPTLGTRSLAILALLLLALSFVTLRAGGRLG